MLFGTTFSHQYLRDHFKLPVKESFRTLLDLKLYVIRLACYWDESEPIQGQYDFAAIEELLRMCDRNGQSVILCLGIKAPRWPEFHFPNWLKKKTPTSVFPYVLDYLTQAVKRLGKYKCIKYYQVENEPLDKSGPRNLTISLTELKTEVELVRQLDQTRPIILSLWGNKLRRNRNFSKIESLADIIGLDLYYQIPKGENGYWGPDENDLELKTIIANSHKPVWLTELQTNPWKHYMSGSHQELFQTNLERAMSLAPAAILLWSSEYWLWQKKQGNSRIWQLIKELSLESYV